MLSKPEAVLLEKIGEEIESRARILAQGGVKDYSEYRESVGFIDGLKAAVTMLYDVNKEIGTGKR